MQNLRLLACAVAVLGSLTAAGCGSDNDCEDDNRPNDNNCVPPSGSGAAVLVVKNQCTVPISEIHVAAVGTTSWGANLISGTVFLPNGSATITVPCGTYAVELVDQNGHTAILNNVNLCAGNADWIITSANCVAFTTTTPPNDPVAGPASGAAH